MYVHTYSDKNIFRLLSRACHTKDTIQQNCINRDEMKQRLDSKSPLGELGGFIFDVAGYMLANQGVVSELLNFAVAESIGVRNKQSDIDLLSTSQESNANLLGLLAKHISPVSMT